MAELEDFLSFSGKTCELEATSKDREEYESRKIKLAGVWVSKITDLIEKIEEEW